MTFFQDNLEDDDTYIYLQCVNGLVAVADRDPDEVVDVLTREFALLDDRKCHKDKAMEVRTKIGKSFGIAPLEINFCLNFYLESRNLKLNCYL